MRILTLAVLFVLLPPAFAQEEELTPSGLRITPLTPGDGAAPQEGDVAVVAFTVWLEDGTRVDRVPATRPLRFTVGGGNVIAGLDEAVRGMREGARHRVVVPAALGFGDEGNQAIPPGATLVFELALLEAVAVPRFPELSALTLTGTETGLRWARLREGSGDARFGEGSEGELAFVLWSADGTTLASSFLVGEPMVVQQGLPHPIPGLFSGIDGMRLGERRLLVIPASLQPPPTADEPPQDWVCDVELVRIIPPLPCPELDRTQGARGDDGVWVQQLAEGEGRGAAWGDLLEVHESYWNEQTGALIYSTKRAGEPTVLALGSIDPPALEPHLEGVGAGAVLRLVVPGAQLSDHWQTAPDGGLVVELEVLAVRPGDASTRLDQIFARFDVDGDGQIAIAELEATEHDHHHGFEEPCPPWEDELGVLRFLGADRDDDRIVTREELRGLLQSQMRGETLGPGRDDIAWQAARIADALLAEHGDAQGRLSAPVCAALLVPLESLDRDGDGFASRDELVAHGIATFTRMHGAGED